MNEFPDMYTGKGIVNIGTKLEVVERLVNNNPNIEEEFKNCIFNMIQEDKDKVITDEAELQKILCFLNNCKVTMKNLLPGEKNVGEINSKPGEQHLINNETQEGFVINNNKGINVYFDKTSHLFKPDQTTELIDKDQDGIVDETRTRFESKNSTETFIDSDVDGEFDYKVIETEHSITTIYKNEKGEWDLANRRIERKEPKE